MCSLTIDPYFHSSGTFPSSHILLKRLCSKSTCVSRCALITPDGIPPGSAAFPIFQRANGSYFGGFVTTDWKLRSRCWFGVVWEFPEELCPSPNLVFSSHHPRVPIHMFTGLSACWTLLAKVLVMRCRSFRFPFIAAASSSLTRQGQIFLLVLG